MLVSMGCRCAAPPGPYNFALHRESSQHEHCGRALSFKLTFKNQVLTSLTLPIRACRIWSPEAFYSAPVNHPGPLRRNRVLGFCSRSLQINGSSAFSHSDDIGFSEVEELPISANPRHANSLFQVVPYIGRALLILGLGLGLSMPALARTTAPPVSTVSAGDDMMQKDELTVKQDYVNDHVTQKTADAHDDSSNSTLNTVNDASNTLNTSEISDDQLRFSESFWKGIPTPYGSYLYNLKMQLDMYPKDTRALEALLQAVMEQRDMLRALTVLETLLDVQGNDLKWKFLKARTHEYLGELFMAKTEYEELLNLQPLSARYLQGLAMLLNKLGEETKALELIQGALDSARSENKDVEARNLGVLLSQFYIQLGNFENALQHLSSMIEQDPDDFRPYLCQGLAYTLMSQKDKAKQSFKKYMQLCPSGAFDHNYLDSLMLQARTAKQMDEFMKAAMKATSRNSKKAKPMKQPSFAQKVGPDDEDFLE